jgi:hypothetical protein
MVSGFVPPPHWTEVASQLRASGRTVLNSAGTGAVSFSPDNASQRWVIASVVVSTNQAVAAQTVPQCTLALNTTDISQLSQGNARGTSWSGNNDTFNGAVDVGPVDFVSLLFYPPPGSSPSQIAALSGVTAYVVVTGTKYTRRH